MSIIIHNETNLPNAEFLKEQYKRLKEYSRFKKETKDKYYDTLRAIINTNLAPSLKNEKISIGEMIEKSISQINLQCDTTEEKNKKAIQYLNSVLQEYDKDKANHLEQINYIKRKIICTCFYPSLNYEITLGEEVEFITLTANLKGDTQKVIIQKIRTLMRRYLTRKNIYTGQIVFLNKFICDYQEYSKVI